MTTIKDLLLIPCETGALHIFCPECNDYMYNIPREQNDPPRACVLSLSCPECAKKEGIILTMKFYDDKGKEVSPYPYNTPNWLMEANLLWIIGEKQLAIKELQFHLTQNKVSLSQNILQCLTDDFLHILMDIAPASYSDMKTTILSILPSSSFTN